LEQLDCVRKKQTFLAIYWNSMQRELGFVPRHYPLGSCSPINTQQRMLMVAVCNSLIAELEEVVQSHSAERRVETLRRVADHHPLDDSSRYKRNVW
jgi:hypothetical protein